MPVSFDELILEALVFLRRPSRLARFVLPGDSVFIFRIRAFVTRAYVVGIAGIDAARPEPQGIFTAQGAPASWPG
jgi:hypothetical protein